MKLYNQGSLSSYLEKLRNDITSEISSQSENYILNVNMDDYAAHIADKYALDIPRIDWANVSVDTEEMDVPARQFPNYEMMGYHFHSSYRKQVIHYYIPYSGNISLLQYWPNERFFTTLEIDIIPHDRVIKISIINFYDDPQKIIAEYNLAIGDITPNYNNLIKEFGNFNRGVAHIAKSSIENQKKKLLKSRNFLSALGVPIKQRSDVAATFAIPKPKLKEKIVVVKPEVKDKSFKPEPTLDSDTYNHILKFISDLGQNLERLPSTYKGKGEEDIRDHILLVLDPNFEMGSASGETFNRIGKTDICLRYDSGVVFIAECKYWKGEKVFLKTIDQLLGYLTWRNSKVAIVNFVQNAEFSNVLNKIRTSIISHPNFLRAVSENSETWFNYKIHLNGDRNREVDLAILSFHLPK